MFFKTPTLILLAFQFALCDDDYSHGFGKCKWIRDINTALAQGKAFGKPVMFFIHESWCPKSVELAADIAESDEILELCENFVMVNSDNDDVPDGSVYAPDGEYVPRILFFSKEGIPLNYVNKWGKPNFKYYFYKVEHIKNAMEDIIRNFL